MSLPALISTHCERVLEDADFEKTTSVGMAIESTVRFEPSPNCLSR